MKKITFILLLIQSVLFAQGTWQPVGADDFNQPCFDQFTKFSSVMGTDNSLYVAYIDGLSGSKLSVRKYANGKWQPVGVPGMSYGFTGMPGLAGVDFDTTIDTNNNVYVVYPASQFDGKLVVQKFNGTSWELIGVPGLSTELTNQIGAYPIIRVDKNNVPYVLYADDEQWSTLRKFNGTTWEVVGPPQISLVDVGKGALVFDSNNVPYVFCNQTNHVGVKRLVGNIWQYVGGDSIANYSMSGISMLMGQDDLPVVAYSLYVTDVIIPGEVAVVKKFNGTTWIDTEIAASTSLLDLEITIAYDSDNVLYAALSKYFPTTPTVIFKKHVNGVWQDAAPSLSYYEGLLCVDSNNVLYVTAREPEANSGIRAVVKKFNGNEWEQLGDRGLGGLSSANSLVVDNNNTPYLVHQDADNEDKVTIRKFNGVDWEMVGAPLNSFGAPMRNLIAIDNNNVPYVVFNEMIPEALPEIAYRLKVVKFNGVSWESISSQNILDAGGFNASLAFDSNNVLYVFYSDPTQNYKGVVKKFNGAGWVPVGTVGVDAGQIALQESRIIISSNDVPYVIYTHYVQSLAKYRINVEKFNGVSWSIVGGAVSPNNVFNSSIILDENNVPYVSYVDDTEGRRVFVKKLVEVETETGVEEGWEFVGSGSISENPIAASYVGTSMKMDTTNMPFVVYSELGEYEVPRAMAKRFNGTDWEQMGNVDFVAGNFQNHVVAIGSDDIAYVAYSGSGVFVKNFNVETMEVENQVFDKDKITVYPNPIKDSFKFSNGNISKVEIYDLQGKLLLKKKYDGNVNIDSFSAGIYILKVSSDKGSQRFKIVKE